LPDKRALYAVRKPHPTPPTPLTATFRGKKHENTNHEHQLVDYTETVRARFDLEGKA